MVEKYRYMTVYELREKYYAYQEIKELVNKHKKCCGLKLPKK
jgi:hypothetical protein